jgi:hypothetical protein
MSVALQDAGDAAILLDAELWEQKRNDSGFVVTASLSQFMRLSRPVD